MRQLSPSGRATSSTRPSCLPRKVNSSATRSIAGSSLGFGAGRGLPAAPAGGVSAGMLKRARRAISRPPSAARYETSPESSSAFTFADQPAVSALARSATLESRRPNASSVPNLTSSATAGAAPPAVPSPAASPPAMSGIQRWRSNAGSAPYTSVPGRSGSRMGWLGSGESQTAVRCTSILLFCLRRANSTRARLPSEIAMRSRSPPATGMMSTRSGSVSAALFASGTGSALVTPRSGDSRLTRASPSFACTLTVYANPPESCLPSGWSSGATVRACSTKASPRTVISTPRRGCVPPVAVSAPPSRRPRTPCSVMPESVNATRPAACSTGGSSAMTLTWFAANSYSPSTVVLARSASGSSSLSRSLPRPAACIEVTTLPALSASGEVLMYLRNSAVGPSAWPLTSTRRSGPRKRRHADPHAREPRAQNRAAARHDLHAVALEGELAVDVFDARPALHIVQHPLLHARAHPEVSARRIHERKIAQVAAHAHANVASGAGNHRLCQPVTRLTAQHLRQVRRAAGWRRRG